MTRQQKYKIQTIARYIILIAVGLVMIYPMIWMVGASFKATNAEIFWFHRFYSEGVYAGRL